MLHFWNSGIPEQYCLWYLNQQKRTTAISTYIVAVVLTVAWGKDSRMWLYCAFLSSQWPTVYTIPRWLSYWRILLVMQDTQEMQVWSLGQEDHWKRKWQPRHNIPWKIPGTEEPGRLQFMGITELDTTEHTHTYSFITYCSKVINWFFNYEWR